MSVDGLDFYVCLIQLAWRIRRKSWNAISNFPGGLMKCTKLLVITMHASDEAPPWQGYADAMEEELSVGAEALRVRYSQVQVSDDVRVGVKVIRVRANECEGVSDTGYDYLKPSNAVKEDVAAFVAGCGNLGVFLVMHGTEHDFAGALWGDQVAGFVNALEIKPRKICVVVCNAARDKAALMFGFCQHLGMDPKPVVAGYHYPVYLNQQGKKLFEPLRTPGEDKVAKEQLTQSQFSKYKKYFSFVDGGWKISSRNVYHDEHF